ncbi:uncharacterized protein LOC134324628 isoform X2 [Trichomycterus rosablanca]|uniref:uncharacterized protein LOC134324628 isoform X2 n=1 Tax=Trichomycterus rosablanca TaxID=2290929 RepID=UPI002F36054A
MADLESILENDSTPEADMNSDEALRDPVKQTALVLTDGDDSVFYSEEEEIQHSGAENNSGLMELESVNDSSGVQEETRNPEENAVSHAPSTLSEVPVEMKNTSNREAGCTEELLKCPEMPLMMPAADDHPESQVEDKMDLKSSTQSSESTQTRDRDESSISGPDEPPGFGALDRLSDASLEEEPEQELDPDIQSESNNGMEATPDKPFNHLRHAKYGTVSYRQIQRGHTKKRIKEFESMQF